MIITACSLAIAYVWHLIEVIGYIMLFLLLTIVSTGTQSVSEILVV